MVTSVIIILEWNKKFTCAKYSSHKIIVGGLSSSQKKRRIEDKIKRAGTSQALGLKRKLEGHLPEASEVEVIEKKMKCVECEEKNVQIDQYEKMMRELKEKFHNPKTSYNEKIKILTLSPWGIHKSEDFFDATNYMVKRSRELKKEYGILSDPPKYSRGKVVTEDQKAEVLKFYENFSRICPGKGDTKSVRQPDGKKVHLQKRLVLEDIMYIHGEYKKGCQHPPVGKSTFAALRPANYILAGSNGTHSVCVCTYHQNPKLMVSAIGEKELTYKTLMGKSVCDISKKDCMLHLCKTCPGENGVKQYLNELEKLKDKDEIKYSRWTSTDRSVIETLTVPVESFIDDLSTQIRKMTRHHFIAKIQVQHMQTITQDASKLGDDEVVAIGDFSENYKYIVQDASQSHHWTNEQLTLHPFICYYKEDGKIVSKSFCFLSDCLKHKTYTVYTFQTRLIEELKKLKSDIKKIIYITDGCSGQYKNKYNFTNACMHKSDFNIDCELHFFATSHGKNACDGLAGTIKRLVAKASLQRTTSDFITTPAEFLAFCESHVKGVMCILINENTINKTRDKLESGRFKTAITLKGTLGYHAIIPVSINEVNAFQTSSSDSFKTFKVNGKTTQPEHDTLELKVNDYVMCIYDGNCWGGMVTDIDKEFNDFHVNFMHPKINVNNPKTKYTFPQNKDECWVLENDIICKTPHPKFNADRMITYSYPKEELKRVNNLLIKM